jgi:hypothetical protein
MDKGCQTIASLTINSCCHVYAQVENKKGVNGRGCLAHECRQHIQNTHWTLVHNKHIIM